jgi:hypothetical protein
MFVVLAKLYPGVLADEFTLLSGPTCANAFKSGGALGGVVGGGIGCNGEPDGDGNGRTAGCCAKSTSF